MQAQTRKHQHNAKVKQLLVDRDSDNVSFLGELVMGRTLMPIKSRQIRMCYKHVSLSIRLK